MPLEALERLPHPEVTRPQALRELVPPQRRRDRRTGARPNGVDRCDRLPPAVLPVVDEHAVALPLQPLGGDEALVLRLEPTREKLGELIRLRVRVPAGDRHQDVDPVRTAGLHVGGQLELLERRPHEVRDAYREREPVAPVGRVEVEEGEVRALGPVDPGVPRVHVDAVHLHHPEQRQLVVDQRKVDEPRAALPRPGAKPARLDPGRHSLRRLLLEERPSRCALAPALHREGPASEMGDDRRRNLPVVLEQIPLRDAVARKDHAVGAREPDDPPALADLDGVAHRAWTSLVQKASVRNRKR